jgi:cell division protein FtsW
LQFSELAKVALVGVLADFWSRAAGQSKKNMWPWVVTAVIAVPPFLLVFAQPHLSAAVLLLVLPFCIACYAGAPWRQIVQIAGPLVLVTAMGVAMCKTGHVPFLKDYQRERIVSHFSDRGSDSRGGNYQAEEGRLALIRGGYFGTGPGGSLLKHGHLPAPHTDFILAIIGEEWGLVGMLGLLMGYGLIIFFCFQTGHCADSTFHAILCAGVGTLLAIQLVCNAGVVTGMIPVTGMPLPLLSYGGSGLICTLAAIGLVLSVSREASRKAAAAAASVLRSTSEEPVARATVSSMGGAGGFSY